MNTFGLGVSFPSPAPAAPSYGTIKFEYSQLALPVRQGSSHLYRFWDRVNIVLLLCTGPPNPSPSSHPLHHRHVGPSESPARPKTSTHPV